MGNAYKKIGERVKILAGKEKASRQANITVEKRDENGVSVV